jgi:hypothetical protein
MAQMRSADRIELRLSLERQSGNCLVKSALRWDFPVTKRRVVKSQTLRYVIRGRSLRSGLLFCNDSFQPRDVFQEALTGQYEEVIAELRILKVDFKQPFVSYGQDLSVFYALDRPGSLFVGRKEAKFSHETSWRKLDTDFLDQKLSCDSEEHFGSRITLPE